MNTNISPIIQPEELLELRGTKDMVIVNAGNGKDAKNSYDKKHLKGAIFADLNTQLSDIKEDASNGGRHPLPVPEKFSRTLTTLGISPESHVVIYDDKNGANAAARFWWMMRSAGHEKVQVLNGGFQAAEKAGFPMSSQQETATKNNPCNIEQWQWPLADLDEVERASQNGEQLIIDVRDNDRYLGIREPIDLIAGHIPGAINVPFHNNLDEEGRFKPPSELKTYYENISGNTSPDHIIVHCGSGVTACHTILAMAYAGLPVPKLYTGSWSEWSRNNKTIKTG
ncbi:sulfurtransferase [Sinomicrobium weinanense]|uniref:Sulfurtransferase n=1 Tax=Sinomicrobium weinanense TaxID=2842200 RepID=A0A926Q2U8_9FLAO|nr:sulfurtransferase [Sinomicrobium weinanense]MBC9796898.1 sulfurtransferase [Sinomicrobium weinanense]MBU3124206.1 sulfurtransferase [Sinomicrobium weinanense]